MTSTSVELARPRGGAGDGPPGGRRAGRLRRRTSSPYIWLATLLVVLTVFQRLVVPGAGVSLSLAVAYVVVLALSVTGHIALDRTRALAWLAALAGCILASVASRGWARIEPSTDSLTLLLLIYVPVCFRVSADLRDRFPDLLELFQKIMIGGAVACVGQYLAQVAGWPFSDLLAFVPETMRVGAEDFNLSYPLYYGSSIYKSNGIVFLEPSFASQFMAMAIIIQLLMGRHRWRIALFGLALLSTLSGTGMVLLGAGLVILAARRGGKWALRAGVLVALTVAVVSVTPAGDLLGERTGETGTQGTSGNIRFVAPYENVLTTVPRDTPTFLAGRGPGSVTRDEAFFNPTGQVTNYSAAPKLLAEYGLPATLAFLVFMGMTFFRRVPSPTLGIMMALMYFVLSGALLQPMIVLFCWFFSGLFAAGPERRPRPPGAGALARPGAAP